MDAGGPPIQVDNAPIDGAPQALAISIEGYHKMQNIEDADWVAIVGQIFKDTEKWATPANVLLDNREVIRRCKESCYTPKAVKEGKHQTHGSWKMDFLWPKSWSEPSAQTSWLAL